MCRPRRSISLQPKFGTKTIAVPLPRIQRGELWVVDLGYTGKVRPVLVVSVPFRENERTQPFLFFFRVSFLRAFAPSLLIPMKYTFEKRVIGIDNSPRYSTTTIRMLEVVCRFAPESRWTDAVRRIQ